MMTLMALPFINEWIYSKLIIRIVTAELPYSTSLRWACDWANGT